MCRQKFTFQSSANLSPSFSDTQIPTLAKLDFFFRISAHLEFEAPQWETSPHILSRIIGFCRREKLMEGGEYDEMRDGGGG